MKNKEPLILAVVVFFSLVTYYLVEPYAHHVLHKDVESKGFVYDGSDDVLEVQNLISGLQKTKEEKELEFKDASADEKQKLKTSIITLEDDIAVQKVRLEQKKTFFSDVARISKIKGDAVAGEAMFATCSGCHNDAGMVMGTIPPSLVNAGVYYTKNYLIGIIKDPAMISNVDHKFSPDNEHPMASVKYMVSSDEDIANVVAYMQKTAISQEEVTPKMAYENACGRCHAVEYEKWTQLGTKETFKHKKDTLAAEIKVLEYEDSLKAYMGKLPPDLSMYIRSRSEHFISTFMENPQSQLEGTSMPRVGVTADTAEKVIEYLKDSGDAKRHEREEIGRNVMIYIVIFALFAFLWKRQIWKDLH